MSVNESVFTVAGTPLVFGPGCCAARRAGTCARAGVTRALVVTDPHLAAIGLIDPVVEAIRAAGVEAEVFAGSGVEPSEASVTQAVEVGARGRLRRLRRARRRLVDRHGQDRRAALDATRAASTTTSTRRSARARPCPARCSRCSACPTTGGTGAEATTVAIIDLPEHHVKTRHLARPPAPAARHRRPRPDADDAARGDRVGRSRRALPRHRVVHGDRLRRAAARRLARRSARPTRAPIRLGRVERAGDRACGRRRCATRWPTAPIALRAATWRSLPRRPVGPSGRPACTSRTPAPIPWPGSSTSGSRPATRARIASCRTASRSCVTAPASFRFTEPRRARAAPARCRAAHRRARSTAGDHDALPRAFEQLMRDVGAPRGPARARLRRGRPARARRRGAQAAAPARVRALRGDGRRSRGHPPRQPVTAARKRPTYSGRMLTRAPGRSINDDARRAADAPRVASA